MSGQPPRPGASAAYPRPPAELRSGLCVTHSRPDLWSGDGPGRADREAAQALCRACPARAPCFTWSLALPDGDGAGYGGLGPRERRAARRERQRLLDAVLGRLACTRAGRASGAIPARCRHDPGERGERYLAPGRLA
jgi:hypothetical protein